MPVTPSTYDDDQEPENRCSHCKRLLFLSELNRFACFLCEDRARAHLKALPAQYDDLGELLTPGRAGSNGPRVSASKTAPLPVTLGPLDLRAKGGIVTLLQDVEDSWRRARRRTISTFAGNFEQTLADVTNHLTLNLTTACESYEEVADDLDTISTLYFRAKNTIEGTQPRLIPVHCRYLFDDGTECEAPMNVDINRTSAKCHACGTRWGHAEWMGLFEAVRERAA